MAQLDLVDRYARLMLAAERYQRGGHAVPAEMVRAIQAIESRATATLTREQLQAAQHHVSVAKSRIIAEENRQQVQSAELRAQRNKAEQIRRSTQGALGQADGLSVQQFEALRDGKPVHIPPRVQRVVDPAPDEMRRMTRAVDKRGKGFTSKEWEERLDELVDASPESFNRMAAKYNVPRDELRKAADEWQHKRVGFELERRLGEKDKGEMLKNYNPREQLRAQLVDAVNKHAPEQFKELKPDQRDDFLNFHGGFISDEALEEDSTRGDIARAWAEAEHRESADAAETTG